MSHRQGQWLLWLIIFLLVGSLQGPAQAQRANNQAGNQAFGPTVSEGNDVRPSPMRPMAPAGVRLVEQSYSQFVDGVERGAVRSVTIVGQKLTAELRNGQVARTYVPEAEMGRLVEHLQAHNVVISARPADSEAAVSRAFAWLLPLVVLLAVWMFLMRQMQGASGNAMEFKKSRAKQLSRDSRRAKFNDVAGIDEAREDLEEIVDFLRDPGKFLRLGGRIPSGVLLIGEPGTGKTLVARAVAGEARVPFFSISGSEFVEMFVGVGASRVRDMFQQAKQNSPCIIFIDEIDALGRRRGTGVGGGHDEREQTLNQLLVEMDGFEPNNGVILIAATNRPDVLDPALLRPGRFDRQIVVPRPDVVGREKILRVHTRKVPLASDVDLKVVARGTPGFSGAELANLVNEAALLSARRSKHVVASAEFEDAKDKLIMGSKRGSMVMTQEDKKRAAYHEAGHALVALHMPAGDPVHKVTIIPRGQSLGMMVRLPERDRMSLTRGKCLADLAVAMGGRVAEELIFGAETITSSAAADISAATKLARAMVTQFGMSQRLGPLSYGGNAGEVFAGQSVTRHQQLSDRTQNLVDEEIQGLISDGHNAARCILTAHLDSLHAAANGLLEHETLSGEQLRRLLAGEAIERPQAAPASPAMQG
jgi:cell division protease FtsH